MIEQYFGIWDTENNRFVTVPEAEAEGADVSRRPYAELFSDDEGELAMIIHEASKVGEWEVVPVNVTITMTR